PLTAGRRSRPAVTSARADLLESLARQLVGALVEGVAGMAAYPMPAHAMTCQQRIEPLPKIDVPDRLSVRSAPAVALPLIDPRQNAVAQILAVGVDIDETRPLQRFERGDRRHQFHAVVGGVRLAALELLFVIAEGEDRAPAARPRIAGAGTIGVDDDVRLAHSSIP